jgi:large subunit ribosomal protein L13
MKTFVACRKDVIKKWYVVDAKDQVIGRLATQIAMVLRGKTKPIFTPHCDTGDFVVVVNAEQALLTGINWTRKFTIATAVIWAASRLKRARQTFQENRRGFKEGSVGHVAEEQFGKTSAEEIKDLYRRRASPSGSETRAVNPAI